jgi:hypothetical protein
MIIIRPDRVTFDGQEWPGVARLAVDRLAPGFVREYDESGPYPTFADAPEQLVRIRLTQAIDQTQLGSPRPGDLGQLRVELGAADEQRRLVRIDAVVESVTHDITPRAATRTVSLVAVSDAGDEDPVVITDAS